MPKANKTEASLEELKETVLSHIDDLLNEHIAEAVKIVTTGDERKGNITFAVKLDFSETAPAVETGMTFSEVHKDKRQTNLEDPKQARLPGAEFEVVAVKRARGRPKGGGKMAAAGEKEPEESA
jgi:hypothetical protein